MTTLHQAFQRATGEQDSVAISKKLPQSKTKLCKIILVGTEKNIRLSAREIAQAQSRYRFYHNPCDILISAICR